MSGFRLHAGADGVLYLAGELDLLSAELLEAELASRADGRRDVVVDLSDVTFIDSTGIRAFLRVARGITPRCLVLRHPQPNIANVLEIVGIRSFGVRFEHDAPE